MDFEEEEEVNYDNNNLDNQDANETRYNKSIFEVSQVETHGFVYANEFTQFYS